MLLHSNKWLWITSLLCCYGTAFAEELAKPDQSPCVFYEYIKDSDKLSDPANQATSFIQNNWIVLENDLAKGHGEALSYLRSLTLCQYVLPNDFWKNQLRGLPYQHRQAKFTKLYSSTCFCSR